MKPEQIAHIQVVDWFHLQYPDLAQDFHHFANERKCTPSQGYMLKRMGVKRGVADFHLAYPVGKYHGLWLELKSEKGRLTPEQKLFLERKSLLGYCATTAWGFFDATQAIKKYLDRRL